MKALAPCILVLAAAWFLVAGSPPAETPPPGAAENITAAIPPEPMAKPLKPRKLLVFSKTNGFRHASIATGRLALAEMGRVTGAYEAVLSEDLADFEEDQLTNFDAVCFLSTTQNVFSPRAAEFNAMDDAGKKAAMERDARLKANLMRFVKSGRGFVGIHAATDTCQEWAEYGRMINGFFDGHPWNADTMVSIEVEPGQEQHPLAAMFEGRNLEFQEEIYQLRDPYDSKSVHMLLRLDTARTDMTRPGIKRTDGDFGVSWARHWEQGRVFYTSIGHNHEMYWHPKVVRHYLAGIQWALGDLNAEVNAGK
ncbi:MAG: ThuA domain-containing protein [Verrucomicrobia bacterium]|nr:ThuA domain-containing protein [Verrucomicrobiota bacterium]